MKVKYPLVKGFRDFYPNEMSARSWLFDKMREVSRLYGYEEYEGPALETVDLYAAKSGEELVKQQTFLLTDRGGKKLALRPELTPTLARMVSQKANEIPKPIRWFSIGPRWRYEQPQKGRTREFYQWDVDLLGVDSPEADAEIIAIACEFLRSLGLTPKQVVIKINNRRFLEKKLNFIGITDKLVSPTFRAIDKKEKMSPEDWQEYLKDLGLSDLQIKDLQGILKDLDFSRESDELTSLFSTLKDLGFGDFVEFDPSVVRGLDYYTGTVFEACDTSGEFRAILGGGRYDNLLEVVGGPKIPGIGFAAGDVVVEEVLKKFNLWPQPKANQSKVLVTVFDESTYRDSLKLAKKLREKKVNTEIYLRFGNLDKQLKYADQKGIPYALILGPNEANNNTVTIKNLTERTQRALSLDEVIKKLS